MFMKGIIILIMVEIQEEYVVQIWFERTIDLLVLWNSSWSFKKGYHWRFCSKIWNRKPFFTGTIFQVCIFNIYNMRMRGSDTQWDSDSPLLFSWSSRTYKELPGDALPFPSGSKGTTWILQYDTSPLHYILCCFFDLDPMNLWTN
jgi:hypothetical protein